VRSPKNNGLSSLATKTDLLGSPSSAEKTLNNLTLFVIVLYLLIGIQLNFNNL
jgi:preprotein translocase subunit SecG